MGKKTKTALVSAADTLTAALLPLARTMIRAGFGVGELVHAVKLAYIHAAVSEVIPLGGKVNVSRLSVATGLTRKEIAALLDSGKKEAVTSSSKRMMEQRAFRVLRGWSLDSFFQRKDGKAADLELRSGRRSFSSLVRRYAGDVTPMTVLRELERMKVITLLRSGKVRLRAKGLNSRTGAAHQMTELARLIRDFARTAQQVAIPREHPVFFGFRETNVASLNQAALFHRVFSQRATALLESIDQWVAKSGNQKERVNRPHKGTRRVGLGVYLVQEGE